MGVALAVLVFVVVFGVVGAALRPRRAGDRRVVEALAAGGQLVDVRTPDEFAADPVPGARNLPLDQLASRRAELDRARPVVVFCASGWRSAAAAQTLTAAGFTRVIDAGGRDQLPERLVVKR